MAHTLADAADWIGGTVAGDGATVWNRARSLLDAGPGDLVLIDHANRAKDWVNCPAAAAVVPLDFPEGDRPLIRVAEPLNAFLKVIEKLRGPRPRTPGCHPGAVIDPTATIGAGAAIGPFCSVGAHTVIGANATLHAGVHIGAHCQIGSELTLHPNVVVYDDTVLGDRVTVHATSVIGSDGYGYRTVAGKHIKIPQLGNVEIGDDVEIGSSATIDRGTLGPTRIGNGTKIDNLVMIAHNCQIGPHNFIVAQVGIAGSSSTGPYVVLAGQAGVVDHVHVGEHSMVGAQAAVTHDLPPKSQVVGSPCMPVREYLRAVTNWKKLPDLRRAVAELERNAAAKRERE